ncbi:MAG: hypothetical protein ACRDA5_10435 [Clostridium sp.]
MFKLDHFVVNISKEYQKDKTLIDNIINAGFPYKPSWGKGTKGFKVSNLWIGNEYFEMINILKPSGGGWKSDWVDLYNNGHRGLVCIMLDVENIDELYANLISQNIEVTKPEHLKFKWFLNLFTRVMPWKNCYVNFLEGIPLQIGFQQMNDAKSREFMNEYMVPNSRDNSITGISKVRIKGPLTSNDKKLISSIFHREIIKIDPLTIQISDQQVLVFEECSNYEVNIVTNCNNEKFDNKIIAIENIVIKNNV